MMNQVDVKDLRQLKNLAEFLPVQLEKLAAHCTVKTFDRTEIIFDQDEDGRFLYLLVSGIASLSYINSQKKQTIVSMLAAGEFFGLDSLTPQMRHPFRCEAFEDCTVGFIRPQAFIEILLGASYEAFLRWYTAVIHPGRTSHVHCIKGIGLDLRRRLALELLNLADRFGTPDSRGISIALNLSHEQLASIVGASRQQVTEYLNRFDHDNIIFRDGRRIIIDTEKLEKILNLVT